VGLGGVLGGALGLLLGFCLAGLKGTVKLGLPLTGALYGCVLVGKSGILNVAFGLPGICGLGACGACRCLTIVMENKKSLKRKRNSQQTKGCFCLLPLELLTMIGEWVLAPPEIPPITKQEREQYKQYKPYATCEETSRTWANLAKYICLLEHFGVTQNDLRSLSLLLHNGSDLKRRRWEFMVTPPLTSQTLLTRLHRINKDLDNLRRRLVLDRKGCCVMCLQYRRMACQCVLPKCWLEVLPERYWMTCTKCFHEAFKARLLKNTDYNAMCNNKRYNIITFADIKHTPGMSAAWHAKRMLKEISLGNRQHKYGFDVKLELATNLPHTSEVLLATVLPLPGTTEVPYETSTVETMRSDNFKHTLCWVNYM